MPGRPQRNPIARGLVTGLLGLAVCFAATALPAFAEEGAAGSGANTAPPPAENSAAAPAGAAGMTIHIDPKTGAILKAPAPGSVPLTLSPQEQNAMSTSHEGLTEVPSARPGGGVKVDLQGRFQSPLMATVGANGKVIVNHLGEPPEADHQH